MFSRIGFLTIIILSVSILLAGSGCSTGKSVNPDEELQKSRTFLIESMKNGSEATRKAVIEATGNLSAKEALPVLEVGLKDRQPRVVDLALKKIIAFKDPSSINIIRKELGNDFDTNLIDTLITLGAKDLDANIEKGLRSLIPYTRAEAVELYGKYKGEAAKPEIEKFLTDNESVVVLKAKLALGRLGDKAALSDLGTYLDDFDIGKRGGALKIVDDLDLKEYRDKVYSIAKNDTRLIGSEALRILIKWKDPEAGNLLKDKIKDTDFYSLYTYFELVEKTKDKTMVPTLRELMASSAPRERYVSARMLYIIDPENSEDALKFLISGMGSDLEVVREQVAKTLGNVPDNPEVKKVLETKGLTDGIPAVVKESLISLGKVGDKDSLKLIAPILESGDTDIKLGASIAIINILERINKPSTEEPKKES